MRRDRACVQAQEVVSMQWPSSVNPSFGGCPRALRFTSWCRCAPVCACGAVRPGLLNDTKGLRGEGFRGARKRFIARVTLSTPRHVLSKTGRAASVCQASPMASRILIAVFFIASMSRSNGPAAALNPPAGAAPTAVSPCPAARCPTPSCRRANVSHTISRSFFGSRMSPSSLPFFSSLGADASSPGEAGGKKSEDASADAMLAGASTDASSDL